MTGLDLRPLSLGEILDRTFSLYRQHFLLFLGLAGIPQVFVLAIRLAQITLQQESPSPAAATYIWIALAGLVVAVASMIAYLFSQGGTILAVSEIYLGRRISIAEALQRVQGDWDLFSAWYF